jgi:hypothetical protein
MKKEVKYVLFLVLAIVLVALVYFLSNLKSKSGSEAGNVSGGNDSGITYVDKTKVAEEIVTDVATPTTIVVPTPEPVYTKPIKLEMMDDAEKKKMGLDVSLKVQVLGRTEDGQPLGYRVITPSTPILEKFGN